MTAQTATDLRVAACCARRDTLVIQARGDLARAATRAARNPSDRNLAAVTRYKAALKGLQATQAEHLANCTEEPAPVYRPASTTSPEDRRAAQSIAGRKGACRRRHGIDCGCWAAAADAAEQAPTQGQPTPKDAP